MSVRTRSNYVPHGTLWHRRSRRQPVVHSKLCPVPARHGAAKQGEPAVYPAVWQRYLPPKHETRADPALVPCCISNILQSAYQVNLLVGGYGNDKDGNVAPQL